MRTTKQRLWSIVCRFRGHPMDWRHVPVNSNLAMRLPEDKRPTKLHGRCQLCGLEDFAIPPRADRQRDLSSYPALSEFVARHTPIPGKLWKPRR